MLRAPLKQQVVWPRRVRQAPGQAGRPLAPRSAPVAFLRQTTSYTPRISTIRTNGFFRSFATSQESSEEPRQSRPNSLRRPVAAKQFVEAKTRSIGMKPKSTIRRSAKSGLKLQPKAAIRRARPSEAKLTRTQRRLAKVKELKRDSISLAVDVPSQPKLKQIGKERVKKFGQDRADFISRMTRPSGSVALRPESPAAPSEIKFSSPKSAPLLPGESKLLVKKPVLKQKREVKSQKFNVKPMVKIEGLDEKLAARFSPPRVALIPNVTWNLDPRMKEIARQLNVPALPNLQAAIDGKFNWQVIVDDRVKLRQVKFPREGAAYSNPRLVRGYEQLMPVVFGNFTSGPTAFRQQELKANSPHIKALKVGDKASVSGLNVLDVTGGLGVDSFLMASAGAIVTVVERNPLVYTLLYDSWYNASQFSMLRPIMRRIRLVHADSVEFMQDLLQKSTATSEFKRPDVVYIDTMFPAPNKVKSKVKKEMTLARSLVGEDEQLPELLKLAKQVAGGHVVLKRPYYVPESDGVYKVTRSRSTRWECFRN